ncbi:MAG: hypothetical protein II022_01175, partial [Muribaculaceae bacterium]|nr:hypothetical protein [Muribaculaceae bacterium]
MMAGVPSPVYRQNLHSHAPSRRYDIGKFRLNDFFALLAVAGDRSYIVVHTLFSTAKLSKVVEFAKVFTSSQPQPISAVPQVYKMQPHSTLAFCPQLFITAKMRNLCFTT